MLLATWNDIKERALYCTVCRNVVSLYETGYSKERALIAGVWALSEAYESLFTRHTDLLNRTTQPLPLSGELAPQCPACRGTKKDKDCGCADHPRRGR